jgi:hypothetical protein
MLDVPSSGVADDGSYAPKASVEAESMRQLFATLAVTWKVVVLVRADAVPAAANKTMATPDFKTALFILFSPLFGWVFLTERCASYLFWACPIVRKYTKFTLYIPHSVRYFT